MKRAYGLLVATGFVASIGCGPVVTTAGVDPVDGTGGGPNTTTVGQGGGFPGDTSSSTASTGGPVTSDNIAEIKGDKLAVSIANYSLTCGVQNFPTCGPETLTLLTLNIPLSDLEPGAQLSLQDAEGMSSGSFAADPSNVCGGGGGTYWDGTVEVLEVTATTVKLQLSGTGPGFFSNANSDGTYVVDLCGPPPPHPQHLTSAVAKASDATPGNLTLFATNLPNTCADPQLGGLACSVAVDSVAIDLPPAMQAVGTYSLNGIATSSSWAPSTQAGCAGGGGSYWDGTIEIVSIDAGNVVFKLSGTDTFFSTSDSSDGSFTAPRCN